MTNLDDKIESTKDGMSRRSVVRAAGAGALAVPAITIASAAPAMAAGTSGTAGGTLLLASWDQAPRRTGSVLTFNARFQNLTAGSTVALFASVTIIPESIHQNGVVNALLPGGPQSFQTATSSAPAGWTVTKTTGSLPLVGGAVNTLVGAVTFYYTATAQIGPNGFANLFPSITLPGAFPSVVTLNAQAGDLSLPGLLAGVSN